MKTFFSFSQALEDLEIYNLLKSINLCDFRWVDVGANDPYDLSVTKFFSNFGGHGVNIEPQPWLIERLNLDRPDDINLQVGISNENGEMTLYGEGVLASFVDDGSSSVKTVVPVVTLSNICNENLNLDEQLHLLKIDVEGFEKQVLEGADFVKYRPWVICIESSEPESGEPSYDEWEDIIIKSDYVFLGQLKWNRFYCAKEQINNISEFKTEEELRKEYTVIRYDEVYQAVKFKQRMNPIYKFLYSGFLYPLRKMYSKKKNNNDWMNDNRNLSI